MSLGAACSNGESPSLLFAVEFTVVVGMVRDVFDPILPPSCKARYPPVDCFAVNILFCELVVAPADEPKAVCTLVLGFVFLATEFWLRFGLSVCRSAP